MTARRFGDFELQHRVGRDGPFLIFRARQVSLGRSVILKILPERTATLERAALLRREAEAADKLDHPGILRVFETGTINNMAYLARAAVDGERLADRLKLGPMPPRLALDLTRQMAEAMLHAHERGVLHGALRPEAVWLTRDGQARLVAFGCPIQFEDLDEETVAGNAGYLAPEQAGARGAVGRATDVYGLGALLYAMATGGPPHSAATVAETCRLIRCRPAVRPSRLRPDLPPAIDEICLKCLRSSPGRRYGPDRPLMRLIADIRRAPLRPAEPNLLGQLSPWLRRHGRLVLAAALVLVLAGLPACWDRQRHQSAWETLGSPDAAPEFYDSAARHFERLAADQPFDDETRAGLALAQFRTGRPMPEPPSWYGVNDEWAAVRAMTRILAAAKSNRRDQAHAALRAAHVAGYSPRSELERRLFAECEQALAGKPGRGS